MTGKKRMWKDYFQITAGTAIMAFAIKSIYDPAGLVTGGVSGIAIVVKSVSERAAGTGLPLWLTTTVLNIPLFLAAVRIQGAKALFRTLYATAALSFFLGIMPDHALVPDDLLLAAVYGGVLSGIGFGLVLGGQATTGGTDLLAALIHRRVRYYSVAQILQVLDGLVVLAGALAFGIYYALYAMIAVFMVSKISDTMIEGWKFAKQAYIISDQNQQIAARLMAELGRGATHIYAKGMYSKQERGVLYCVVSKKEIVRLKEITAQTDPNAFVIVSDAREVLGEGFIELSQ